MTLHDALDHLGTGTKHLLDALSATVAVGVIVQLLPPLAAAMTITLAATDTIRLKSTITGTNPVLAQTQSRICIKQASR